MADVNPTGSTPPAGSPTPAAATSSGLAPNMAGALAYFFGWITGVIFLVLDPYKNDKFIRFHAFQSIFFNVALIPVYIVLVILMMILGHIAGILSFLLYIVFALGVFGLWLFLMFQAYSNKTFKLPLIGDFAAKQAGL